MAESEPSRLMRRLEVMAYLKVGSSTLYRWIDLGIVPAPLPGTSRWDSRQIDQALDRIAGIKNGVAHDDFEARKTRWSKRRPQEAR